MQHTLFVYGTLRRGYGNHGLMGDAPCLGRARTKGLFALFSHGIPYLSRQPRTTRVTGEVYVVDDLRLARIDRLEAHPHWYVREEIEVVLENGRGMTAWCYFNDKPRGMLLASGDFADARA